MDNYYVIGRGFIPEIKFEADKNYLEVSGQSYHEYTREFFQPAFRWLEEYLSEPGGKDITLFYKMKYFNTASSKCLFDILEMVKDYVDEHGGSLKVSWHYKKDDFDMLETGEDFADSSGVDIEFVEYT